MLFGCRRVLTDSPARESASAESFNPELTTEGLVDTPPSTSTLDALASNPSTFTGLGTTSLKPFFWICIDILAGLVTNINDFDRQFLSTESTRFLVLILLHGNIHPVAVAFVRSVRYQAYPNFIHI